MQKLNKSPLTNPIAKQKGAALIIMTFIIGLAVIAYLLHALDPQRARIEQDKKTIESLNAAKQALIAWSVSHPNTPGLMPYPDRNADGNYDDTSDCYASNVNFAPNFTLGRLPLFKSDPNCVNAKVTVASGVSEDFRDGAGERLWYEVSSNLLHDYKNNGGNPNGTSPVINPSIINNPNPIYPWFVVRDRNGVVISNRVAAVIIAPGTPSGAQARSGGIANANQYLDRVVMADGTPYKNYGYQDPATNPIQEFIISDDFRMVAKNDPTYKNQAIEPYYYNDKLVYITIDELMYALEKRVLQEAKDSLNKFKTAKGYYPFAAGLGSATNPNQCTQGNLRGLLPVDAPATHTCTCASGTTGVCNCNFDVVNMVSFTRKSGSFATTGANVPRGACSVSSNKKTCTCNGDGACKSTAGVEQFKCTACGQCTATVTGTNSKAFIFTTTGTLNSTNGDCSDNAGTVECDNKPTGDFTIDACDNNEQIKSLPAAGGLLPAWFIANQWEKYIVYAVSDNCVSTGTSCTTSTPQISVGANLAVRSLVATSLADPNDSCDISSYLSSTENTNVVVSNGLKDTTYQVTQPKTQSNSDQLVVVAP